MKKSRHLLTTILMVSSVILLIILQILWLHASYEKAFRDFERESVAALRTSMDEIRDSVFTANLRPVARDSMRTVTGNEKENDVFMRDSLRGAIITMEKGVNSGSRTKISSNVKVIISSSGDSLSPELIRPLREVLNESRNANGTKNFVIRIDDDSLDASQLKSHVSRQLSAKEIPLAFRLASVPTPPGRIDMQGQRLERPYERKAYKAGDLYGSGFVCGPVAYNPVTLYTVEFDKTLVFYLAGKLSIEISFCIFLTVLICSAFYLIQKSIRKQQQLMKVKDEFISNVSHELKTPIATVSVALEALQNFGASGNPILTKEYLDIAQKQLTHLTSLTDQILTSSLTESTKSHPFSEFDIRVLAEQSLSRAKILGLKSGATFSFSAAGNEFRMHGAEQLVSSMLINLLENALKYSPVEPRIDLSLERSSDNIVIAVKDNGIGIPPEYHEKIFDKFFRVPTGNVHDVKGFGLGLSYVSEVVKIHHGRIEVSSAEGAGSKFVVTLPVSNTQKTS